MLTKLVGRITLPVAMDRLFASALRSNANVGPNCPTSLKPDWLSTGLQCEMWPQLVHWPASVRLRAMYMHKGRLEENT